MHDRFDDDPLFAVVARLAQPDVARERHEQIGQRCRAELRRQRARRTARPTPRRIDWMSMAQATMSTALAAGFLLGVLERAWMAYGAEVMDMDTVHKGR